MKVFEVAARADGDDSGTKFKVKDAKTKEGEVELLAYQPDEAQFAVLMATTGRGTTAADRIAGIINFFVNILDEEGADYLTGRLLDRKDPFGIKNVEDIMEWLSTEWTGNPTQEPSGSTQSPSNDGPKSTEPNQPLI